MTVIEGCSASSRAERSLRNSGAEATRTDLAPAALRAGITIESIVCGGTVERIAKICVALLDEMAMAVEFTA